LSWRGGGGPGWGSVGTKWCIFFFVHCLCIFGCLNFGEVCGRVVLALGAGERTWGVERGRGGPGAYASSGGGGRFVGPGGGVRCFVGGLGEGIFERFFRREAGEGICGPLCGTVGLWGFFCVVPVLVWSGGLYWGV